MNILKVWIRLEKQPTGSIAKQCFNIYDKMANEKKTGLINKINLLCTQLNLDKNSIDFHNPTSFISKAKKSLSEHLKNRQLNLIYMIKNLNFMPLLKTTQNHPTL